MHPEDRRPPNPTFLGAALAIAPVAVGCAAGLLLADRMPEKRRRSLATSLLSVGVIATLPLAVDYVAKTLDSPARQRGSDRKLDGIRHSGINPDADIIGGETYFADQFKLASD